MRTLIVTTLAFSLLANTALAADTPKPSEAPAAKAISTTPDASLTGDYTLDTNHASITFTILHMGLSHYTGRFNKIDGDLHFDATDVSKSTLKANVTIASIDTHNSTLEAELTSKDWFNANANPQATFVATKIEKTGTNSGKITGDLTINGVTKPVVLDTVFNAGGADPMFHKVHVGFSAKTVIKRSEFNVSKYIPLVGDEVAIDIEAEFLKKE